MNDLNTPEDQEIEDFLKCLEGKSITDVTRKNIVETFGNYKDLLMSSQQELQSQRLNRNNLSNDLDNLMFFILHGRNRVEEALNELFSEEALDELSRNADDVEKQRQFRDWARDNINEFKNQLGEISNTLKDENHKNSMEDFKKKWGEMKKELEELLEEIKHDFNEAQKKKIWGHILVASFFAGFFAAGAAGAAAGAAGAEVGLARMAAGAGAGAAAGAVGAAGSVLVTFLKKNLGGNTKKVQKQLIRMTDLSDKIETRLDRIRLSLVEINGTVIRSENASRYAEQLKSLVKDLRTCKENLDELVDNIREAEDAVSSELDSFNERIYKPLLRRLYGSE